MRVTGGSVCRCGAAWGWAIVAAVWAGAEAGEDWFPHISPDGKKLVFLSFPAGTEGHNGRMAGMQPRLMAAPDSRQFAFVIYEPVPAR
jgi:hypothetical protein